MKSFITVIFSLFICSIQAQELTDFESIDLEVDRFLNGGDGSGGFDFGEIFLPNSFTVTEFFSFWSGWAISSKTDTLTQGFTNQYSSIVGSGNNGSQNYAVTFAGGEGSILKSNFDVSGFSEIYVTNSTYAYWSMREGDSFAKRFGGIDGNDPDFFLLTIKGYYGDTLIADSVNFYLADYRFEDNTQDYIVDTWEAIDLSPFDFADSLQFTMSSSDTSAVGINTPAYFCMDDVTISGYILSTPQVQVKLFDVFPNPSSDYIIVNRLEAKPYQLKLFDLVGREVMHQTITSDHQRIELGEIFSGSYILEVNDGERKQSKVIIKR